MNKNEREEWSEELNNEFDRIESEKSIDISKYIGSNQDLPEFEAIDVYDYNKDVDDTLQIAKGIVGSLADMYLGDVPEMRNHIYILNKVSEDSLVYGNMLLIDRVTRKNYLQQSRLVDSGDQSPKTMEMVVKLTQEMRENSKYQSIQRTALEKFYKEFRADFGLKNLSEQNSLNMTESKEDDTSVSNIVDSTKLNDIIDNFIKDNNIEMDKKRKRTGS